MNIDRLNLLARVGAVQFADKPNNDSGGGSDNDDQGGASHEGTGGDKDSGDSDDSDEDEDEEAKPKGKDDEEDKDDADGFTPITSQAELNKVIGKRIERERAKFSDYDQLKTENTQLKKDLAEATQGELLRTVSEDTGVPVSLLRGSTEDELRAHADEIKTFMGARGGAKRKPGHSPHTGTGSERPVKPSTDTGRERARATAK